MMDRTTTRTAARIVLFVVRFAILVGVGLILTLLSFTRQDSLQVNAGNLCGIHQDEPCLVSVPTAGWPLPYLVDHLGTSTMGVLGLEDLRIGVFLLDLLFYALLLGGIWWLFSRAGGPTNR